MFDVHVARTFSPCVFQTRTESPCYVKDYFLEVKNGFASLQSTVFEDKSVIPTTFSCRNPSASFDSSISTEYVFKVSAKFSRQ